MRLVLKLTNSISRVLEKLLQYFNGTTISVSFVLKSAGFFPVIITLHFNDVLLAGKLTMLLSLSKADF